mgnify:CR=1 FL=1
MILNGFNLDVLDPNLNTSKTMSKRYVQMDTRKLVTALLNLKSKGQPVFELRDIQTKKSKGGKPTAGRGIHFVKLRTTIPYELNGELLHPEIVIKNSYDGSCPLIVLLGIFRIACSNGLIVTIKDLGNIKIRHMGTPEEVAVDVAVGFAKNLRRMVEAQEQLASKVLSDEEMIEFAVLAAEIRWKDKFTVEETLQLLEVARPEDEGSNLWAVMNRVQEKLMNGGIKTAKMGRTSRKITNGSEDARINQEVWALAMEFAN